MARILLLDDEENVLKALRRALTISLDEDDGYTVEMFTHPEAALQRASSGIKFDVVISDYRMPAIDGVVFLKIFQQHQPDAVRVILSGYADMQGLIAAINDAHIHRFIAKPWDDYLLRSDIAQLLRFQALQIENRRLADQVRHQQGIITRQDLELRRLEAETPGITKVKRAPDGSVLLDDDV
jgi:DNA-binding NtrC family response regulator